MVAIPQRYLHQIAAVPLLTRDAEVAIAKRIEHGERQVLSALVDSPMAADAGSTRSGRRARWSRSPDLRRAAIAKVRAIAAELAGADAELRSAEERQAARRRGVTCSELAGLAIAVERAHERIAALERAGGSPAAAQRKNWRRLAEGIRIADRARAEMVRANLRLVVSIARPYLNRGVSFFDLIQEGNLGLMKGIEKFDYRRGFKLCTYAVWWIRMAMSRAVTEQARIIRVPLNVRGGVNRVAHASRELERAIGREPTTEEIAGRLAISPAKVQRMLSVVKEPLSLEAALGPDGGALEDLVEDRGAISPAQALLSAEVDERTRAALSLLTAREAKILRLRFGIGGPVEHTLEQIGRVFGLTRERIRQIEAEALTKLRRRHAGELRPLLEA